jgi:hypothetical protein
MNIRTIADELALINHPIDDMDLVIAALNGLGPSFREFTASIQTRDTPIMFDELFEKLVDFEIFLQRDENHFSLNPAAHITANLANHRSDYHPGDKAQHTSKSTASLSSTGPAICQFYEKRGHIAKTCYKIHCYPSRDSNNFKKPHAHCNIPIFH